MKTKKITLFLVSLFLTSCVRVAPTSSSSASSNSETSSSSSFSSSSSSSSSETSSSDPSTYVYKTGTLYEANYDATEDDYLLKEAGSLSYMVDPYYGEDRAFVSVSSMASTLTSQSFEVKTDDTSVTFDFSGNMGDFTIRKEDGCCTFTSLSRFGSTGLEYPLDIGETLIAGNNPHTTMTSSSLTAPASVSYTLSDYSIPYYFVNDDVYLPTLIVSDFFLYSRWSSIAFNGNNFYKIQDPNVLSGGDENLRSEFGHHYYETSTMKDKTEKSQAVANLDANCFLFTIDTFYGFIDNEPYSNNYGAYLKKEYPETYEGLFSTNADTVLKAYDTVIRIIMGDGHSSVYSGSGTIGSFYNEGQHSLSGTGHSQRYVDLVAAYNRLLEQRRVDLNLGNTYSLGENYLEMNDTTAIIRFDSFVAGHYPSNQTDEFYETNATKDLFSLFYTCYRKIEKKGSIKNVIVDLSCNLGGDSVAMIAALGFMIENPKVNLYDRASATSFTAYYRTDCNADGIFEDDESPAGKYNQYVLTSASSFSCGNAMPYYAKVGGVKTIGQTSGGGGCAVLSLLLSDGYPARISGPISLGKESVSDEGIDGGITPDITIPEEDFYNIDKLTEYITAE